MNKVTFFVIASIPFTLFSMEQKKPQKRAPFASWALLDGQKVCDKYHSLFVYVETNDDESYEDLVNGNPDIEEKIARKEFILDMTLYVNSKDVPTVKEKTPFSETAEELQAKVMAFAASREEEMKRTLALTQKVKSKNL